MFPFRLILQRKIILCRYVPETISNEVSIFFQGAMWGGVAGLVVVVVVGAGAQLSQIPTPRLPASIAGCTDPQNLTAIFNTNG